MATVVEYSTRKAELEEKIRGLENEKATLVAEISALKEKISMLELERIARALESEVQTLRNEKELLEQRATEYSSNADQNNSDQGQYTV